MPDQTTRGNRTCPGCGRGFASARGLRAHASAPFQAADCRPRAVPARDPEIMRREQMMSVGFGIDDDE